MYAAGFSNKESGRFRAAKFTKASFDGTCKKTRAYGEIASHLVHHFGIKCHLLFGIMQCNNNYFGNQYLLAKID